MTPSLAVLLSAEQLSNKRRVRLAMCGRIAALRAHSWGAYRDRRPCMRALLRRACHSFDAWMTRRWDQSNRIYEDGYQ